MRTGLYDTVLCVLTSKTAAGCLCDGFQTSANLMVMIELGSERQCNLLVDVLNAVAVLCMSAFCTVCVNSWDPANCPVCMHPCVMKIYSASSCLVIKQAWQSHEDFALLKRQHLHIHSTCAPITAIVELPSMEHTNILPCLQNTSTNSGPTPVTVNSYSMQQPMLHDESRFEDQAHPVSHVDSSCRADAASLTATAAAATATAALYLKLMPLMHSSSGLVVVGTICPPGHMQKEYTPRAPSLSTPCPLLGPLSSAH